MNQAIPHTSGQTGSRGRKLHLLNSTPYQSARSLGYGLLEIGLGLAVMGAAMVGMVQMQSESATTTQAIAAASRLQEVNQAAQAYMKAHFKALTDATTAGGDPIEIPVGRKTAGEAIPNGFNANLPSLQGGGFLPDGYIDRNSFRQNHRMLVRQTSVGNLEMMVTQVTPAGVNRPGDRALGQQVQRLGASSGAVMTTPPPGNANIVLGAAGGWRTPRSTWNNAPAPGSAVMTTALNGAAYLSDYLNRHNVGIQEANTMRTGILMDNNSITDASIIDANTRVEVGLDSEPTGDRAAVSVVMGDGGYACANDTNGCSFWISNDGRFRDLQSGWIDFQASSADRGLRISGTGNNLSVQGNVGTGAHLPGTMPADFGGQGISTDSVYGRHTIGVGQGGENYMAYMNASGDGAFSRNLTVGNDLTVGRDLGVANNVEVQGGLWANYIRSNGQLSANSIWSDTTIAAGTDIVAGQDLTVGRNANINQSAGVGQNLTVGQNGRIGGSLEVGTNFPYGTNDGYVYAQGGADFCRNNAPNCYVRLSDDGYFFDKNDGQAWVSFAGSSGKGIEMLNNTTIAISLRATVGAWCERNGMIGQNVTDGGMLWCQNNFWRSPNTPFQTLESSFSSGGTYSAVNTSSSTIFVSARHSAGAGRGSIGGYVNGALIAANGSGASGGYFQGSISFPVPPGASWTVQAETNGGIVSADIAIWR